MTGGPIDGVRRTGGSTDGVGTGSFTDGVTPLMVCGLVVPFVV